MAENKIDILINSFFNDKGTGKAIKRMQDINKAADAYNTLTERSARVGLVPNISKDGILTFQNLAGYTQDFDKSLSKVNDGQKKFERQMKAQQESIKRAQEETARFNSALKKQQARERAATKELEKMGNTFSMEFLGILFFGMQMQMLFGNLAKSTVSNFMKITEGATSQGQAISALNATWTLLSFTVGSAVASVVESLLPTILPVIEAIVDWVDKNSSLVGWSIILGFVLGTVLLIIGSLYIGIEAIINSFVKLTSGTNSLISAFIKFASVAAADMGWGFVFSTIFIWIGIIIAVIAVLYAAWQTNFGGIQEFTKGTFGIIWEIIKTVFGALWDIIKLFFGLVLAIFQGDWGKVVAILIKEIGRAHV